MADEDTIILRRFEVSVSGETKEDTVGAGTGAAEPDELEPNDGKPAAELAELVLLVLMLAMLMIGGADADGAGASIAAGLLESFVCCLFVIEPTTAEAALALAGITGLAFASAIW